MAKKPVAATLTELINSPEYKGMSDLVKQQVENALLEIKGKPPLPKTSKTSLSTEEVLANPAMTKAIKEKIGEEAAEEFLKKVDEKSSIDDTDKPIVIDKQNKVKKTKQKTKKQQALEQQENLAFSLKDFILGKGTKAFNKMFPQLGALMGGVYRKGDKPSNNNTTTQTNNTSSNISGTTAILSSIFDSQKTSVDILQQILTAIKATPRTSLPLVGQNQTPPPPVLNQNRTPPPSASNQNQRSSSTPPITGPRAQMNLGTAVATVAGGAAIAGVGYAAQQTISGSRQAERIINESGNWSRMGSHGPNFLVRYSSVDGKFTLNGREVDRETYARFRQLTLQRDEENPRYARYLEEERKGENAFFAESNAARRVARERLQEISELMQRVERMPLAPAPVVAAAPAPAANAPQSQASQTSVTPESTSAPHAAQTPAAPGTEYDINTGVPIGAPATTDATRSQPTTELSERQKQFIEQFLRSRQKQNDNEARSIVENIVQQRNMPGNSPSIDFDRLNLLFNGEQLRRAGLEQGTFIENRLPISVNSTPIASVTPVTPATPIAPQSTPSATPTLSGANIRMGREIGQSSRKEAPSSVSLPSQTTSMPSSTSASSNPSIKTSREISESPTNATPILNNIQRPTNTQNKNTSDSSNKDMDDSNRYNDATPTQTKSASQEVQEENLKENNILNFKANEISFKADKFEFVGANQTQDASAAPGGASSGNAPPAPNTTTQGGSGTGSNSLTGGSGTGTDNNASSAAAVPNATQSGGNENGGEGASGASATTTTPDASQAAAPPVATGLNFAPGVDQRIKPGIADKVKEVQSGFGKGLSITSGFRDPGRNARVGGATGSKHLTGDAVDVKFSGNQEDTINFIKAASAKGLGGIGVYGPGFVHIDTGPKRVWGPDYHAGSIPQWAKAALDEHMTGKSATPTETSPSSGSAVARASTDNEISIRSSPASTNQQSNSNETTAPAQSNNPSNSIDPNDPGPLEPADAGIRYARLFSMAA
jgi:Peptidase M15